MLKCYFTLRAVLLLCACALIQNFAQKMLPSSLNLFFIFFFKLEPTKKNRSIIRKAITLANLPDLILLWHN